MNATTSMTPPFALRPTGSALPVDIHAGLGEAAAARSKYLAQSAMELAETMRASSLKALRAAGVAGGAAGNAALDAMRAAWAVVMAILRWIARAFNMKAQQPEKQADKSLDGEASPAMPAMAASLKDAEAEVNTSADEFKETVGAASQLPADDSLAFMKAMEAAGLSGADAAFMNLVRDPATLANSKAPTEMMLAALNKAQAAIAALEPQLFEAQAARAKAAAAMSDFYSPPLNVEDLVSVLRATRDQVPADKVADVDAIFAAEDHLQGITSHIALIKESTLAVVASARQAGVELEAHGALIDKVVGDSWEHRVGEVSAAMAERATEPSASAPGVAQVASSVYGGLMERIAGKDTPVPPAGAADPAATAAQFMAAAPRSAASRLRQAAADSAKFLPPGLNDHSGDDDLSSNPKP